MEQEQALKLIEETTRELLERVGFVCQIKTEAQTTGLPKLPIISVESEQNLSMLIGKNGQNLNALEHIIRLMVWRKTQTETERTNFLIDVNNYRRSKTSQLVELARSAAQRVISAQRAEALAPMSAFERRLVHSELASYKELQTESIGTEPHRRIVIKPLNELIS